MTKPVRLSLLLIALLPTLAAFGLWSGSVTAQAGPPVPPEGCRPGGPYACSDADLAALRALLPERPVAAAPAVGAQDANPPVISVWNGLVQRFGDLGQPQRWLNVPGNITDTDGVGAAVFALNGGPARGLTLGPDGRRLAGVGDFNVEIGLTDTLLVNGPNQIVITATDTLANQSVTTVSVNYTAGTVWPLPFTLNWSNYASLAAALQAGQAQVGDGRWQLTAGGVRLVDFGYVSYDRGLLVGDRTWRDYEITIPITVHQVDYAGANNPVSGSPGLGMFVRWRGHTDSPLVCPLGYEPHCGWLPLGASGWYDFGTNYGLFKVGGDTSDLGVDPTGQRLQFGVPYYWKVRLENVPSTTRTYYHLKVWPAAQAEPAAWTVNGLEVGDIVTGSVAIVAHHVDATIGNVTVVAGPFTDTTAPVFRDLIVARRAVSATVLWTTDEPVAGQVEYGLTGAYGATASTSTFQHRQALVLTGLTPDTVYHYRVTAVDPRNNQAVSQDLTFRTTPDTTAASAGLVNDDFNRCSLGAGVWTFGNPLQDTGLALSGGFTPDARATLAVPAGAPHVIGQGVALAPSLTQPAANTDFDISVKFDSPLTANGQSQGLLAYQDEGALLRAELVAVADAVKVQAVTYVNGRPTTRVDVAFTGLDIAPLYLRLQRQDNVWRVYRSLNGQTWSQATPSFTFGLAVNRVGLLTANLPSDLAGTNAPAQTAAVDYFSAASTAPAGEDEARLTVGAGVIGQGTVTPAPAGPNYGCGDVITLTATPAPGWAFAGWSGALSGSANPAPLSLTAPAVVTATFTQNAYALTTAAAGSGTITRAPDQATYLHGSVVTLTAAPQPGWTFLGWSGDLTGGANPAAVTMTATKAITATFAQNAYALTTSVVGQGTVVRAPNQAGYLHGTVVTVTAVPAQNWLFAGWSGALTGTTNPAWVTMTAAQVLTATFTPVPGSGLSLFLPMIVNAD